MWCGSLDTSLVGSIGVKHSKTTDKYCLNIELPFPRPYFRAVLLVKQFDEENVRFLCGLVPGISEFVQQDVRVDKTPHSQKYAFLYLVSEKKTPSIKKKCLSDSKIGSSASMLIFSKRYFHNS